jgi:hypothetical protein
MYRQLLNVEVIIAFVVAKMHDVVTNAFGATIAKHAKRYRPEKHDMRGPGPKWYANHVLIPAGR